MPAECDLVVVGLCFAILFAFADRNGEAVADTFDGDNEGLVVKLLVLARSLSE